MRLIGENIIIRDLKYDDAEAFFEYASNDLVGPRAGWKPVPSLKVAKRVVSSYMFAKEAYAIALKENNKLIGTFSIYHENILRKYKFIENLNSSLFLLIICISHYNINTLLTFFFKRIKYILNIINHRINWSI